MGERGDTNSSGGPHAFGASTPSQRSSTSHTRLCTSPPHLLVDGTEHVAERRARLAQHRGGASRGERAERRERVARVAAERARALVYDVIAWSSDSGGKGQVGDVDVGLDVAHGVLELKMPTLGPCPQRVDAFQHHCASLLPRRLEEA